MIKEIIYKDIDKRTSEEINMLEKFISFWDEFGHFEGSYSFDNMAYEFDKKNQLNNE